MSDNIHWPRLTTKVVLLTLFFGLFLFMSGSASMFLADMLTPNGQGVLSVQIESFLPLFHAVLVGLAMIGRIPSSLILFSILLAASVILFFRRRNRFTRAAIVCLALACLAGSSLWEPNPIVRWPISILGDHDERQLICKLFPVHIVNPSWITSENGDLTMNWMFAETMARGVLIAVIWSMALLTIARLTRSKQTANKTQEAIGAQGAPQPQR